MRRQIEVSNEVAQALTGAGDHILRALESHVSCDLFLRGNVVTLDGDAEAVAAAAVVVRELSELIEQGHEIAEGTIAAVTSALDQHQSPGEILEDVIWRHRSTKVAPKTVNQKRYVDSIRRNTITFGIGPAGTGKTFLAVAMAAAALSRHEVTRIILTRLGFNSKMVITGDITQIDLPRDQRSGLVVVSEILAAVEGVEFVRFGGADVVRHRLVQRIVEAYDEHSERAAPELRPAQKPDRRRA